MLGSGSTGGITLHESGTPVPCSVPDEDSGISGGCLPPSPRNSEHVFECSENANIFEGGICNGPDDEEIGEEVARRRLGAVACGGYDENTPREKVAELRTAAPEVNVSDWSLQSCDETDDGAVRVAYTFLRVD